MSSKRLAVKRSREQSDRTVDALPELALAAIASYKKQKEVNDFINFLLGALERNSDWLNSLVGKQNNFRCAFMTGAGPNRFQLHEVIYPSEQRDIKLEVEHIDSEDYDKVAIAALFKLPNQSIDDLLRYIKTRLFDNASLKEDLLKGKEMGISFAVLRPVSDKQYRLVERIILANSARCASPIKKRTRDEKLFMGPITKKARRVA